MGKRKREGERGHNLGGLFIPAGLFLGMGIGKVFGFEDAGTLIGLGIGFLCFMMSRNMGMMGSVREIEVEKKPELPPMVKENQEVSPTYLESTLKSYGDTLHRIEKLTASIPSEKKVIISEIVFLLQKINEYVEEDSSRYSAVKVFFQTYISSTETIIQKYKLLMDQPVMNDEAVKSLRMIDAVLIEMKAEYEEAYSRLYEKDVTELQLEITNLRTKFKEEKVGKWL